MNTTTITITDPKLIAQLVLAEGQIVFRGPGGEYVKAATAWQAALAKFGDENHRQQRNQAHHGQSSPRLRA